MSLPVVKFENYTGHDLYDLDTGVFYKSQDQVARCSYKKVVRAESVEGSEICEFVYTSISGLPDPKEDVVCIVSSPVLNAVIAKCGNDGVMYPKCCSPHNIQRNKKGEIIGCKGFRFNG